MTEAHSQQNELLARLEARAGEKVREAEAARLDLAPEDVDITSLGFIYTNRRENGKMYGLRGLSAAIAVCAHHILATKVPEKDMSEAIVGTLATLRNEAIRLDTLADDNPEAQRRVQEIYTRGQALLGARAVGQAREG